jgi:diketogulonate reductase-like aldo/keto reductase
MTVPTTPLPGGDSAPVLGQGTWRMGEQKGRRRDEVAALRLGIELGMTLLDTAEMYAEGEAERVVAEAIQGRRDEVFVVSKAYPHNAGARDLPRACEASLKRLGTDRIDLYLLHWRGSVPLGETVAAFEALRDAGKIRHWGVSNFDADDMAELAAAGGTGCAANQILYNLEARGPEFDLLPHLAGLGIPAMAYCPIAEGRLARSAAVAVLADRLGVHSSQVALAWVLRRQGMIAIPKASRPEHVRQNRAALDLALGEDDLDLLDHAFAPPRRKVPLAMV